MKDLLKGKKALITGVASNLSIAYGIAESLSAQGAELCLTYQAERFQARIEGFGEKWDVPKERILPLDVTKEGEIESLASSIEKLWGEVDIVIHAMAFAPRHALEGQFVDVTDKDAFLTSHEISAYSFIALARAFRPMLKEGSSLITLSYIGAEKVIPNYNVMGVAKAALEASVRYMAVDLGKEGVRVNAISAGPIRTLAAAGIKDFRSMLRYNESRAALKRNVTTEEVGNAALFLSSPWASGVTGEVLHVDAGFSITAMGSSDNTA